MTARVAVLGASGYAGGELVRLLARHPRVELVAVAGSSRAGEPMAAVFPHLRGLVSLDLADAARPDLWDRLEADFVFLALPSGQAAALLPQVFPPARERGVRVIDLSGDLRLPRQSYEAWYGRPAADPALQAEAVYGLSELFSDRIRTARLVANPGCYPTAILLALAPLAVAGALAGGQVVVDAKSGVSGAGRSASLATAFAEVNENFAPYKVGRHQHTPEVEQVLGWLAGRDMTVLLTTHLLPVTRGILATCYVRPPAGWQPRSGPGRAGGQGTRPPGQERGCPGGEAAAGQEPLAEAAGDPGEALYGLYRSFYAGKPFVRVLPPGQVPAIKHVQGSNLCDIGLHYDPRTGWITVFAAIDNLVKGAAGQAVQNLNLMAGWDETTGLDLVPLFP
ncbi:N-acetyl-gamma-glutamyl-phosphate reductase [Thermaerobacter subterraneus]|uniref:N-acetyl-gamma-glutamyl-phosphate reductase n=1 Tax=Thermaerobacter subterraneus DSM 13965 TaxID=867903 RepID=K6PZQ9_9FIRM|nr:N-acetyl-gamma-glutamyl-phosphate reductase [Thermaerobacter subterraneus]EKP94298.1 N-acetyl-gamma-glutamyl-phosphate reductase [Thermaerobacter subterraneus DSM 13965]